jgi:hypothetical protein
LYKLPKLKVLSLSGSCSRPDFISRAFITHTLDIIHSSIFYTYQCI